MVSVPMPLGGFEDDDLTPGKGKRAGHRQADDSGADHDAIDRFVRHGAHCSGNAEV